jgi:hypothetical protein
VRRRASFRAIDTVEPPTFAVTSDVVTRFAKPSTTPDASISSLATTALVAASGKTAG